MTKYEYSTFVLGTFPTVASKYRKLSDDLQAEKKKGLFKRDNAICKYLKQLKSEYDNRYESNELSMDDELQEKDYWIHKLAKQGAVELLSVGKVSVDTMSKVSCLDNVSFVECVKQTTKLSSYLNNTVQQAEKAVLPEDIVPEELMR